MTVVQLGFLLTISAPFILAVWVAFRRWPNPIVNTEGMLEAVGEMDGRGLTRARFAAETNDVEENARIKLKRKRLDMIAANQVGDGIAFDCDDNALTVIWPGGKVEVARGPKIEVARQLVALIAQRLPPPDGSPRRGPRKRRIAALPRDRVRARRVRR